jgi:hypothetical protein
LKAVRYRIGPDEYRIGRLDGDQIVDAGPAGEQGFVPTRAAWAELAAAEATKKTSDQSRVSVVAVSQPRKKA